MRIGVLCPYSLTMPGGVQGQVLGLAAALRALGQPTTVLAPCDGPPPTQGVLPLGRSVPAASNGSMVPFAPDPAAQLRTIRALRDEDFDVLHIHEPFVPGVSMTALLVKTAPIVGTFHAAGGGAAQKVLYPAMRRLARRIDVRCAVSEDARKLAEHAVKGNYQVLFNGIDVARFSDGAPWPTDGPTVLFVGRHEPRKGLRVLLDALRWLPADLRVWVASDGPETAMLQERHADDARIEWLGRISDAEVAARMRGADLYCAPSLYGESFGVVLLEAMAAGTPVVASDIPGYDRVARHGHDAVLVAPDDPSALAAAIHRVLDDPALAGELTAAGSERAASFSMDRLAQIYLDIYEDLLAEGTSATRSSLASGMPRGLWRGDPRMRSGPSSGGPTAEGPHGSPEESP